MPPPAHAQTGTTITMTPPAHLRLTRYHVKHHYPKEITRLIEIDFVHL